MLHAMNRTSIIPYLISICDTVLPIFNTERKCNKNLVPFHVTVVSAVMNGPDVYLGVA